MSPESQSVKSLKQRAISRLKTQGGLEQVTTKKAPKGATQPEVDYSVDYRPALPEGMVYLLSPWANGKTYLTHSCEKDWDCTRGLGVYHLQRKLIECKLLENPLPSSRAREFLEHVHSVYGPWTMMGVMRAQFLSGILPEECDGHYDRVSREKIGVALGFNLGLETVPKGVLGGTVCAHYLCPDGVVRRWPSREEVMRNV